MLNRYGPCLDSNLVVPLGPDRCEVRYEFFFFEADGESTERFLEESVAQSEVTQREDVSICESVQRGLASKSYDTGRYAPQVELVLPIEEHVGRSIARAAQQLADPLLRHPRLREARRDRLPGSTAHFCGGRPLRAPAAGAPYALLRWAPPTLPRWAPPTRSWEHIGRHGTRR